jgi:hypothetical protein
MRDPRLLGSSFDNAEDCMSSRNRSKDIAGFVVLRLAGSFPARAESIVQCSASQLSLTPQAPFGAAQ